MNIQKLLQSMAERVSASASVKCVYGDPVVAGNRTAIPAAQVHYAFGGGGGTPKATRKVRAAAFTRDRAE